MEQMREGRNGGKLKTGGATNGGRPKKVFSVIIAEMKERGIEPATPSNVVDVYQYLLALPLSEIIKIAGKPSEENDLPAIMRIAAKELIGKRGLEIMKEMLDRANGKAKQTVETEHSGKIQVAHSDMTEEQIDDELRRLKALEASKSQGKTSM